MANSKLAAHPPLVGESLPLAGLEHGADEAVLTGTGGGTSAGDAGQCIS